MVEVSPAKREAAADVEVDVTVNTGPVQGNTGEPSTTIDVLIRDLISSVDAIENHVGAMNYLGTDEFDARTIAAHPFDERACELLHDLVSRVQQLSDDLYSADLERRSFSRLSSAQQSDRTHELEQLADGVRTDADGAR